VRVEIGPVSGASAVAWIAYGRSVVDHLGPSAPPTRRGVLDRFTELLDSFSAIASPAGSFSWATDVDPEEAEFLMKGLFEIGLVVEAEHAAGHIPLRPAVADEFHHMVVRQVLAEIETEGPAFAQFVEGLRADWGVAGNG
jgi:hypothetical protein